MKYRLRARNELVSKMSTATNGEFEFKNAVAGPYSVEKKYKLAVSLLLCDGRENQECSDSIFEISGDELLFARMITFH